MNGLITCERRTIWVETAASPGAQTGQVRPWDTCTRPSQEGKGQSVKVRSPILPVLMSHVVAPCQPGVAENSWKWHLQEPEWVVRMVI